MTHLTVGSDFNATEQGPVEKKKIMSPVRHVDVANLMNIGYYLLVPVLGGVGLGVLLDAKLQTRPLLTIIFILLGTIASFYNLYRVVSDVQKTR